MTTTEQQELDRMMAEVAEQQELALENQRLTEAQQAIREIESRRQERQKAADIKLLATVRAELVEHQTFYETNLPRFHAQRENYENARLHIRVALEAVGESQRQMPAVAQYLPDDAQVVRWKTRHDALLARLTEAQTAFASLPDPDVLRRELAQVGNQITQLTYSVDNLVAKLEGHSGKAWLLGGDGVSNVGGGNSPHGKAWIR